AGIDRHVASGEAAKALGVERVVAMEEAGSVIARADVVLDFSSPQATHALVTTHANALEDRAIAVGTTGLDPETLQTLDRLALESAVLVAANFRAGGNSVIRLVRKADREAGSVIARADVVLDFSSPQATHALVTTHANALEDRAIAVGTTGLDPETLQTLDRLALESAVLVAANFSVGVNLMIGLVEQAARVLGAEAYDAEVVETHHGRKVDAPSGTALSLAAAIARGRDVELNSVRRDGRSGET